MKLPHDDDADLRLKMVQHDVGLPPSLHEYVVKAAREGNCSHSALIRAAVRRVVSEELLSNRILPAAAGAQLGFRSRDVIDGLFDAQHTDLMASSQTVSVSLRPAAIRYARSEALRIDVGFSHLLAWALAFYRMESERAGLIVRVT